MLEIIIPIYNPDNSVHEILKQVYKQNSQNFSVSIVIDKPTDEHLVAINEALKNFDANKIKLVINSKHQPLNSVIYEALKQSDKPYSYILFSNTELDEDFVTRVTKAIKKSQQADIIEFKAVYRGLVRHDAPTKPFEEKTINLKENWEPLIVTSPVVFNKVFSNKLALSIYENNKTLKSTNKQYSIDITVNAFLKAATYFYTSSIEVRDWNYQLANLNVKSINLEWKQILNQTKEASDDLKDALNLLYIIHYQLFLAGYIGFIKQWKMFIVLGKTLKTQNIKDVLAKELAAIYGSNPDLTQNRYFAWYKWSALIDPKLVDEKYWSDIFHKIY
ncbi:glycosyltransferase family A protein [Mycoplasma sp. 1573]